MPYESIESTSSRRHWMEDPWQALMAVPNIGQIMWRRCIFQRHYDAGISNDNWIREQDTLPSRAFLPVDFAHLR